NASSNPYDNTTSGLVATDVQAAIDEINAAAGTVALVDNADGTYTFTDAGGNVTTISDTSISTMVDNLDGTYTYTDETGATQVINTNASSNPYDNTTSGLVATDVQAAIDEINAAAGTVALVDNADGTYTFTDAAGNNTTISDTSISTLVDNGNATFTYTDETGTPVTINLISADANNDIIAGSDGGLYLNVASVAVGETITNIVDNGDGTFTYTNENGTPQTINKADVTDNADGTYTFDNNDGTPVTIDTNANSNPYDNTTSGLTATDVQAAIDEVSAGSTDDQNISGSGLAGTNLTIGIENGASEIVDLSSLVGTDDQTAAEVTYDNITSGLTAADVQAAIDEVAAGSTDDQNISGSGLAGTNLTIGIENGASEVVDLSSLVGTDDQIANEVNITDAGGNFTATEVEGALAELAAGSSDDQNISGSGLAGTNLTIGIENGASEVVDLSSLVGTDDQTAAEVTYDNTTSGLTAVDVQAAIDEVAAGSTDDQNISGSGLAGTNLTIGIENGAAEVVDLSSLVGTDDQNLSTDSTPGNISIEDGNTLNLNVDDADADATNEYNTGVGMNAGAIEVTDAGGTLSTSLISTDANNDISAGSDGALYLNVASVTISETITNIVDNADGTFTYTNENGTPQTISKADVTDNADGTYTFDNNDGTPVTINTNAGSNPYDNTTSGLTATDVQAALDEVAAGSTDDQNISGSGLAGTNLTIGIENGASEVVDLSSLVGTDDQIANEVNITDAGGNFTATEVEGALAELAAGSSDDQNISGSGLAGTNLTIGIENGASEVVDLSSLVGTDDQTAAEVTYDNTTSGLTAVDVQAAIDEVAAGSTDDQNISGSGLAGNILTIGIENGTNETVDLSALVGTDDQIASEVNITDAGGNFTSTEVEGALAELAAGSTDDQNLTGATLSGANILQIDIENGTSTTVDLSSLDDSGTDDQTAAEVTYDNTTSGLTAVDVQAAIDEVAAGSTDDQNISGSGLAGTNLTIGIENGASEVVDLSSLVGTDDQTLSTDNTPGNISIEDGNTLTLNVDDADSDPTNEYNTGVAMNAGALEVTDAGGTFSDSLISTDANNDISAGSDGALYLNVASVTISETITNIVDNADGTFTYTNENGVPQTISKADVTDNADGTYTFDNNDGSPVTISTTAGSNPYDNTTSGLTATDVQAALDEVAAGSTDDQNISGSGLAGNILTIGIENGTNETVDLSALVGTDDQIANEVNITDAGGNFTSTEVEGALAELAAGSTDDQNISGSGLAGNILTIGIENGTNETVDLSA
ncbi:beta strand repeat-containing protein, partial [Muriicola sp. E247]|uniref:beta strand repeat-containing protein n=1 Tax=Muriicola sp. E247 TaxID=3242730 RepID=UPI003524CC06